MSIEETVNNSVGLKLNIGCGRRLLTDYINIDSEPLPKGLGFSLKNAEPVYLCCSSDNIPFVDETVKEIICDHVLEHQTPEEIYETLWEFSRILIPGGILEIKVPNFEYFVANFHTFQKDYLNAIDAMYAILCNVRNTERMSPHRSLLWYDFLGPLIERSDFEIMTVLKSDELYIQAVRKTTRVVRVFGGKE